MKFNVHFNCKLANYYWITDKNVSLQKAKEIVELKNKYHKIHGDCCRYYYQESYFEGDKEPIGTIFV